ncbi:MAG: type II secretion system F family protein [Planctomycetota bacterium]|nr:type II secretion system F family protein [Planctomycetota bacterium]
MELWPWFMGNALFVGLLILIYALATRRRTRIYLLIDHLDALAGKGLPIAGGLRMISRDLGGFFGVRLARVARLLDDGVSLADALDRCPNTLPTPLRRMLALGDRSGNLQPFLRELRRSYRRAEDYPYRSATGFLYPVVLTLTISLSSTFFASIIMPRFRQILDSLAIDHELERWWWIAQWGSQAVLVMAALLVIFVCTGRSPFYFGVPPFRWLKKPIDRVVLSVPVLKTMVCQGSLQSFSVSTGLLLRAGSSLEEAVRTAGETEPNQYLRTRYRRLASHIDEGGRMIDFCKADPWFPADFLWFVEGGEATAELPNMLMEAGTHFDTKAQFSALLLSRSLVPAFIILNGLLVLAFWLGMFLPIIEIQKITILGAPPQSQRQEDQKR